MRSAPQERADRRDLRRRLASSHTPEAIRSRLESGASHSYLPDFVYGAIDGAVTTFAIVSGVAGAGLSSGIIIVLGIANLIGDGFSMAVSNFLGTRADRELRDKARRTEELHLATYPQGEREEIRQILRRKGFEGDDLERAVEVITAERERWIEVMLREEYGFSTDGPSPWRAAMVTFVAFLVAGALPLLAFLWELLVSTPVVDPYLCSALMTGAAFLAVGAVKARFVGRPWYWSGIETLVAGGAAAALAYLVGALLKGLAS